MALPRFAVFKSNYNSKYLSYLKDEGEMHGYIQFSGEEVLSPYAKFAVEPSKTANGTLVHIRCCYNNKYWVRSSDSQHWIVAASDNQEEDNSKWSCTLFEPVYLNDDDDKTTARFRHVQLGNYACLWRTTADDEYASCLFAGWDSPNNDLCDVFTIINWESLLILPKRVAFKGGANGKYLSSQPIILLQFTSSDIGDPTVGYEVFTTSDGSLRIKSDYIPGTRWACSSSTVSNLPDSDQDKSDLFWPIKVDNNNNVIALRNLGKNNFCRSVGEDNILVADVSTITKEARLEVQELLLSRFIYDVNYRLDDARIYNEKILSLDNGEATNTSENDDTYEVTLTYSKSESKTWSGSVSLSVTVSTTIKTGIPIIAEGEIDVSVEVSGEYEWGKTTETTSEISTVLQVTVPAKSKVKVSLLATQGTCDVPFSYSQFDTFTDGSQKISGMADGVYTGINSYNFKYETTEEKL